MSYIRINISDEEKTISSEVHGATGDNLVAALSAEPETIAEIEIALGRYEKPDEHNSAFAGYRSNEDLRPYDAGIMVIDLAGRTIGCESTYSFPTKEGEVYYHNGDCRSDFQIGYKLPPDWHIVYSIAEYEGIAKQRRMARANITPINVRKVLYGDVALEFIIEKIRGVPELNEESISEIHAEWLMTARADLAGKTPREAMFEKLDLVERDLNSRERQWSLLGFCPPTVAADSFAYRYAGFGTHEMVVYYYMFRGLLNKAAEMCDSVKLDLEFLRTERDRHMNTPDTELSMRLTPAGIVDAERRREPMAMMPSEIMIDDDCPICLAISEDFETPMFWHLDGCNMDWRFEFSFEKTREDWDLEQQSYERSNRTFDEKNYDELNADILEEDK